MTNFIGSLMRIKPIRWKTLGKDAWAQ